MLPLCGVVVAAAVLGACSGSSNGSAGPGGSSATQTPRTQSPAASHGPTPPSTGAWVGAWVKPERSSDRARVGAVAAFEQAVGRPLDLVHVFHSWDEAFPTASDVQFVQDGKVLMISWSGTSTAAIAAGKYDAQIRDRAYAVKALDAPVLIRWRWEMNRPNLQNVVGSPAAYIAAWRHIRAIFAAAGVSNVGWVWCPMASNFTQTDAAAYYPGDDQVDWLCTDVYAIGTGRTFADVAGDFMAWAAGRGKPVLIGEYGSNLADPAAKQAWIEGATAYAKAHPQIKAMVYFDALRTENGQVRDFRVEAAPGPLAAFRGMALDPWFRAASRG